MGAFPLALTKLVSSCEAKGDYLKIKALRIASKKLFFIVGISGFGIMLLFAKPYANLISSSPKCIYTILALAPSVFFSCLSASHRAFAEGFLDMKPTAVSQLIEALFKTVFGLLFARLSMSSLYECYCEYSTVLGVRMAGEQEALSAIYPLTSACAMFGAAVGSFVAYIYAYIYTKYKYNFLPEEKVSSRSAFHELVSFSAPLVGATIIQSVSNFLDTSSVQYCLSMCSADELLKQYPEAGKEVYTYVFGIFSSALDFKNLIPGITMALGITAVPAVSSAFESSSERFSSLLTSIFKYTVILAAGGGICLSLFPNDILNLFYGTSNPDIVNGAGRLLFLSGATVLPCAAASTSVFCVQSLGYSKSTIAPFAVSAAVRVAMNFLLIRNVDINILGSAFSGFAGFLIILVWNMIIIRKKTNAVFSLSEIFVKPVICAALTYFITDCARDTLFHNMSDFLVFILSAGLCLLLYLSMLFLLGSISVNELKFSK